MPFQPIDQGYDSNAVRQPNPRKPPRPDPPRPNGYLSFPGEDKCWLWVSELRTSFSISGQRAQSRRTRSYFPHNFAQPSFTVVCQCANQTIYSRTIEFIRSTQTSMDSSVHLWVIDATRYSGHRNIRGRHRSNVAEGYIKSVKREHGRFIYAPELSFEFVVERHLQPSGWRDDDSVTQRILPSWKEVIENGITAYAKDPDPDSSIAESDALIQGTSPLAPGPDGTLRPT